MPRKGNTTVSRLRTRSTDRDRNDNGQRRWTFEKRVSLDTLVGIVGIAIVIGGPFIIWGRAMEGRVLTMEIRDADRTKAFEQINTALKDLSAQATQLQIAVGVIRGNLAPEVVRKSN
jgi:hypothetical protein